MTDSLRNCWNDNGVLMAQLLADLHDSPDEFQQDVYRRILNSFRQITGASFGIGRIGMLSSIYVAGDGPRRPLQECGDGLRDLLGLLLHVNCERNADLFIDDPGIRLHAGAQRRLLSILATEAERRAIWIATHDLVFVSATMAVARFSVTRQNASTAVSVIGDVDEAHHAAKDLGWLPSDAFVADTLLCCEGPSDKIVFEGRVRARHLSNYLGVVVTELGGAGTVWGKDRSTVLRLAATARSVVSHGKVVALLDRDRHTDREVTALRDALERLGIGFRCLLRSELEDYWVSSPALVQRIVLALAEDAYAQGSVEIAVPETDDIGRFLRTRPHGSRASETLDALCSSLKLRFSKVRAAQVAADLIDTVAPDVATAIDADLDAALAAATSKATRLVPMDSTATQ